MHVAVFARRYGIADDKIAATRNWDAGDARWREDERTLLRLVDELRDGANVSDELRQRLASVVSA